MYGCDRCGEPVWDCVCPDQLPEPTAKEIYFGYVNRAVEEMLRWLRLWRIIPIILMLFVFDVKAQQCEIGDFGCRHHDYHNFYQTGENGGPIMRPDNPTISCCDGDCRPTKVKYEGDKIFAYVDRKWVHIPQSKIKEIKKPDSLAHICATSVVYCLILPEIEY